MNDKVTFVMCHELLLAHRLDRLAVLDNEETMIRELEVKKYADLYHNFYIFFRKKMGLNIFQRYEQC